MKLRGNITNTKSIQSMEKMSMDKISMVLVTGSHNCNIREPSLKFL